MVDGNFATTTEFSPVAINTARRWFGPDTPKLQSLINRIAIRFRHNFKKFGLYLVKKFPSRKRDVWWSLIRVTFSNATLKCCGVVGRKLKTSCKRSEAKRNLSTQ